MKLDAIKKAEQQMMAEESSQSSQDLEDPKRPTIASAYKKKYGDDQKNDKLEKVYKEETGVKSVEKDEKT